MHRHGYKGAKFGRERGQRRALLKSLADSLVLHESIETTVPKAKAVVSYTEKLITKAKVGDLANRRRVISGLNTPEAAHKLVDELSPRLAGRNSGYFRIVRTNIRSGDGTQLAKVSFVDDLAQKAPKQQPEVTKTAEKTEPKSDKAEKPIVAPRTGDQDSGKITTAHVSKQVAKRTGRRGNR